MATVPIVTEVTKAQLDALVAANGLNEGLQYKVTDKGWLLIATSLNTLKAATGALTVINGDDFPIYVVSDFIFIDTGIVDEITQPHTTFRIDYPLGYNPYIIEINVISQDDLRTYSFNDQVITYLDTDPNMYCATLSNPQLISGGISGGTLSCPGFINNVDSFRVILGCYKSKLL